MVTCGICNTHESKYKCPKCGVVYCSLTCFKSSDHETLDAASIDKVNSCNESKKRDGSIQNSTDGKLTQDQIFDRIANDSQIQSMLKMKGLQFHLLTILQILNDPSLTSEPNYSSRKDIALKKLASLRAGGLEANEVVEEFVTRVFFLLGECD